MSLLAGMSPIELQRGSKSRVRQRSGKAVTAGGPVTITATSEGQTATATINAIKPYLLTQVGGQNLPAPLPGDPSLIVVAGRIILYPSGRYSARINYQSGPVQDEGTYVQNGTQVTLTSSAPGTSPVTATLSGNVLTDPLHIRT